jgi:hypothetical protein
MHSLEAYISNTTSVMIYNDFLVLQLDYQERSRAFDSIPFYHCQLSLSSVPR